MPAFRWNKKVTAFLSRCRKPEIKMGEEEKRDEEKQFKDIIDALSQEAADSLERATFGSMTEEEFLRSVFVGDCPVCESANTNTTDEIEGMGDPTVGICHDCGFLWCLECGLALEAGETCGHWGICEECTEEKDEFEDCGIEVWECPFIMEWLAGFSVPIVAGTCAWCGREIPEGVELFAVGAKTREGIDLFDSGSEASHILPVTVAGRDITAIVTARDSRARLEGNELMFMVCSRDCAVALKAALAEQREIIDKSSLN